MRRGSVFLETVVASAIVAMLLAVVFTTIGDSARRQRSADARRLALLVARSQLAAAGVTSALRPGRSAGVDGLVAWSVDIDRYGAPGGPAPLFRIVVTAQARAGGPRVRLGTLKVAPGA